MAALTCAIIPVVFLLFLAYGRISRRLVKAQLAASAQAATVAEESLSNVRTVWSFAREAAVLRKYEAAQGETLAYGLRSAVVDGTFGAVNSSVATAAIMVVL